MRDSRRYLAYLALLGVVMLASSAPALAYVGPGAGLTLIGSLLALVSAVIAGLFGFVWYPLKRLLKHQKRRPESTEDE